jgi:hypothetical protein
MGKQELTRVKMLQENTPNYSLDHVVKERWAPNPPSLTT